MSKHTPGPWHIFERLHRIFVCDALGEQIAIVSQRENKIASARLIAAAPELLEACEWLVNIGYDVGKGGGKPEYGEFEAAILSAGKAITKAIGGNE